jgi:hypothetical protein
MTPTATVVHNLEGFKLFNSSCCNCKISVRKNLHPTSHIHIHIQYSILCTYICSLQPYCLLYVSSRTYGMAAAIPVSEKYVKKNVTYI